MWWLRRHFFLLVTVTTGTTITTVLTLLAIALLAGLTLAGLALNPALGLGKQCLA
jgi:hypothetical protein